MSHRLPYNTAQPPSAVCYYRPLLQLLPPEVHHCKQHLLVLAYCLHLVGQVCCSGLLPADDSLWSPSSSAAAPPWDPDLCLLLWFVDRYHHHRKHHHLLLEPAILIYQLTMMMMLSQLTCRYYQTLAPQQSTESMPNTCTHRYHSITTHFFACLQKDVTDKQFGAVCCIKTYLAAMPSRQQQSKDAIAASRCAQRVAMQPLLPIGASAAKGHCYNNCISILIHHWVCPPLILQPKQATCLA